MIKNKFRAKIKENNEWVFGVPIQKINDFYIVEDLFFCDEYDCIGSCSYKVFENTIGQNSTVKDKNGVEMYEGDIAYGAAHWLERFKPAVVTFRNGSFGLLWHRGDIEEFNPFTSLCNVEYEVVGNIYDNPELMEERI